MSWGEALRLVQVLLTDSESGIWASLSASQVPAQSETAGRTHVGDAGDRTPEEVRAILRELGHRI
jgi:hypothetical protein